MQRMLLAFGLISGTLLLTPALSSAQTNIFDDTVSTSNVINGSSLRIPGTVLSFGPSAGSFDINVFAGANECVRLDVISQDTDLEMVVVAPNGTLFRNDDRTSTDLRPLIKMTPTSNNGWYTVHLARFNGSAVNGNFVLLYGRYNQGNPNCASPSAGQLARQASEKRDTSRNDRAARHGEPGSAE